MPSYKSPATNPKVFPDPKCTGSIIRRAFFIEAMANLLTIPLLTNPHRILSLLLNDPATQINPASVFFARLFGGLIVGGLTPALLAGATNTRNGFESRRIVYMLLGFGEATLVPIVIHELVKGGGNDAALSMRGALVSILCLVPLLLWRSFVLFAKPDLLGRYIEFNGENGRLSDENDAKIK